MVLHYNNNYYNNNKNSNSSSLHGKAALSTVKTVQILHLLEQLFNKKKKKFNLKPAPATKSKGINKVK